MPDNFEATIKTVGKTIKEGAASSAEIFGSEFIRVTLLNKAQAVIFEFATQHNIKSGAELAKLMNEQGLGIWVDIVRVLNIAPNERDFAFALRSIEAMLLFTPIILSRVITPPLLNIPTHSWRRKTINLFHLLGTMSVAMTPTYIQLSPILERYAHGNQILENLVIVPYLLAGAEGIYTLIRIFAKVLKTHPTTDIGKVTEKPRQPMTPLQKRESVIADLIRRSPKTRYRIPDFDTAIIHQGESFFGEKEGPPEIIATVTVAGISTQYTGSPEKIAEKLRALPLETEIAVGTIQMQGVPANEKVTTDYPDYPWDG